ncbi:hypothetical protein BHM03_00022938 [Ensete ventricosum]|nr:hypothetical protein BHM03_00022938 [Ensete ventricosum]
MFPLSFSEERNFRDCSPSRSSSSMDERSSKALEAMLREHDNDSIITETSLPKIRAIYRIPDDFDLYVPEAGQHPFDPFLNGFNLSVNTLEDIPPYRRACCREARARQRRASREEAEESNARPEVPWGEESSRKKENGVPRPWSIRDLCQVKAQVPDEPYMAREIADLPKLVRDSSLKTR